MIALLSTADTELLAAHAADLRVANPARIDVGDPAGLDALLDGVDAVVVRLLGGEQAWPGGIDALRDRGVPLIALGGESAPDAALMERSTVPVGIATQALAYLVEGGVANLANLRAFISDTLLLTGEPFDPPAPMPAYGPHPTPYDPAYGTPAAVPGPAPDGSPRPIQHPGSYGAGGRPIVAVVYYRAHELSGNTAFADTLCAALDAAGCTPRPVYCASLRDPDDGLIDLLRPADAIIVTVLAAGGVAGTASAATAGGDDEAWDAGALARLDVPIIQGLCLTTTRAAWDASDAALSPMDAATQVAVPEFDGRLISVPFSFKEPGPDGIPVYRADPERAARVAGIAAAHARLRHTPEAGRRLAIVLSSYPTKHARVGNAVGLDTPASAVRLLCALRDRGYAVDGFPEDGDELIHTLIAAGGHDVEWLTEDQLTAADVRIPLSAYETWFAELPETLRERVREHWGDPPGDLYVDDTGDEPAIVVAALRYGNVVLMIQPPRGFGENPVAIYHDPDLPPSHHYLAAYRWLERDFGAHAVVHLGKHGTLEWLPGKGLGLAADSAPDAALGNLPLIYPFIVNDPGEGTQAKRRAHATVVDHLVPPMARADTYGDLAKLEQALDEYAQVADLDPAKLPAVRDQIWELVRSAELHHDLHVDDQPDATEFDDFVLHIDGYLCEIKDVQIRDGLHILGQAPEAEARINLVLAVLRATQVWGGKTGAVPGLRAALAEAYGLDEQTLLAEPGARVHIPGELLDHAANATPRDPAANPAKPPEAEAAGPGSAETRQGNRPARTASDAVDLIESVGRGLVTGMEERAWEAVAAPEVCAAVLGRDVPDAVRVLQFAATELVPRLDGTRNEIGAVAHALGGGFVPAGPSGSPTRGLVNVLPTGRNFYSVDPKAIPSRNSWDVGRALADSLLARHLADTGAYPASVGLTVWGTAAMRTQGDDIAEALALLGCRPVWDDASRRVTGVEIIPAAELGRPRVDVTLRISGFFRDAFPHVIALLDDAIRAVADLGEDDDTNHVRAHARADHAEHGDWRRATTRIFGSAPGAYGAGLLPLIDARNWRDDADLARVYEVWGGYAYGRGLDGRDARADMRASFARISVAVKNQDTREHDIVDSDDYFQYHGGMVAMVRALTGTSPAAYVGDSAVPDAVRTRTLAEETRRVFRARVVNPRWIAAMRRHGYKGAFELAATVDYLFGYDATAGVVDDWMYERLAEAYVFDAETRDFVARSNPWALRGMTERLLEAADRGLWSKPDPATLDRLREEYLAMEGDLEGSAED